MQELIALDQVVAANFSEVVAANNFLKFIFIAIGKYAVYAIPFLLLYVWFIYSKKVALTAFLAGLLAWKGLSKLIAILVNRPRPTESLIGVKELIFHRPDTSFPSDHSAMLMALAVTFYLAKKPALGHFTLLLAVGIGVARVGIGVHYPADVLAGWLVGALVAYLFYLIREPLERYVIDPIIGFTRRFKL